jgi:hypothetical protein
MGLVRTGVALDAHLLKRFDRLIRSKVTTTGQRLSATSSETGLMTSACRPEKDPWSAP